MDERVPLIIVNIFNIDHVENVNAPRSEFEEQVLTESGTEQGTKNQYRN